MKQQFRNKLAVPQADKAVADCKVEFASEFDPQAAVGAQNRLAKKCPKKKQ